MQELRYLTDHYDEKIKKINDFGAPLNFVFFTDPHNRLNHLAAQKTGEPYELAVNAIRSIQYILDRCPGISFVVSGGDIGDDYCPDSKTFREQHQEVMDALYQLSVPVHCCIGNHDDGVGNAVDHGWDQREYAILPDEMHRLCMKNNPTPNNYYYFDHPSGYRFVFLDVSDKCYTLGVDGRYPFGWRDEISTQQAEWLEKEALNTQKRVIIFCHAPLHNAGIFGTEGMPSCIKPYDDMINGPRVYHAAKSHKNVVAAISGHVHYDNLLYDDGMLVVTTLCAMMQKWAPSCPDRQAGTITETAFDVFSIKDDLVQITRFGAGEDRLGMLGLRDLL